MRVVGRAELNCMAKLRRGQTERLSAVAVKTMESLEKRET